MIPASISINLCRANTRLNNTSTTDCSSILGREGRLGLELDSKRALKEAPRISNRKTRNEEFVL